MYRLASLIESELGRAYDTCGEGNTQRPHFHNKSDYKQTKQTYKTEGSRNTPHNYTNNAHNSEAGRLGNALRGPRHKVTCHYKPIRMQHGSAFLLVERTYLLKKQHHLIVF